MKIGVKLEILIGILDRCKIFPAISNLGDNKWIWGRGTCPLSQSRTVPHLIDQTQNKRTQKISQQCLGRKSPGGAEGFKHFLTVLSQTCQTGSDVGRGSTSMSFARWSLSCSAKHRIQTKFLPYSGSFLLSTSLRETVTKNRDSPAFGVTVDAIFAPSGRQQS